MRGMFLTISIILNSIFENEKIIIEIVKKCSKQSKF
tara:strand:- start:477 stop:584 length:108 start_codon:yes stop_codon:yes gene_type:complete